MLFICNICDTDAYLDTQLGFPWLNSLSNLWRVKIRPMEFNKDFGRYELVKFIGQGAFGRVFLARDKTLDREVAIKILNNQLDHAAECRFIREVEICLRIRHPNIITIYDGSIERGKAFIAMEYLPAQDLGQILSNGPLSIDSAISIVSQLADALMYLHSEKVLHRDVKPQNVLIKDDERPILMDFNLGLDMNRTALTETGMMVGTLQYMAPELAQGFDYSEATEVYALGCLFHNILAGDIHSILPDKPPLRELNGNVPKELEELIDWAKDPSPAKRCQTMKHFKDKLEALGKDHSSQDTTAKARAIQSSQDELVIVRQKSRLLIPVLLVIALVTLFALFPSDERRDSGQSNLEINLCPFTDGCYASLVGLRNRRPSWRLLSGKVLVASGECRAKGNAWIAEVSEISRGQNPIIQFVANDEVLSEQPFEMTSSPFSQPPCAKVGRQKVILTWKLAGDFEVVINGLFKGSKEKRVRERARNKALFLAEEKGLTFDYEMSLGKRLLAKHRVALGCVPRRDTEVYPETVPWKIIDAPLVIGNTIVAYAPPHILAMEVVHLATGPQFKMVWMAPEKPIGNIWQMASIENEAFILFQDPNSILLVQLDLANRKRLGLANRTPIGKLKGESLLEIAQKSDRPYKVTIKKDSLGKYHCVARWRNDDIEHFTIAGKKVEERKLLGRATDFQQVEIVQEEGLLILRDNELLYKQVRSPFAEKHLLELKDGALLREINHPSSQPSISELELSHVRKNLYALRAGKHIAFFEVKGRQWKQTSSLYELPVRTNGRTSTPMVLGESKVLVAVVREPDNSMERSVVLFVTFDLTSGKMSSEQVCASYAARKMLLLAAVWDITKGVIIFQHWSKYSLWRKIVGRSSTVIFAIGVQALPSPLKAHSSCP